MFYPAAAGEILQTVQTFIKQVLISEQSLPFISPVNQPLKCSTVKILNIGTCMSEQTV